MELDADELQLILVALEVMYEQTESNEVLALIEKIN